MGKNKKKHNGIVHKNKNDGIDIFGVDARQIGAAVAGIVIGEIVEAAVQRFGEQHSGLDGADDTSDNHKSNNHKSNPLKNVASQVEDRFEDAGASAKDTAETIRASAGDTPLNMSDVVDVLRDAGERLKDRSSNAISTSSGIVADSVSNRATAVLDRVLPDSNLSDKLKKDHKHSKKSKKKKKH